MGRIRRYLGINIVATALLLPPLLSAGPLLARPLQERHQDRDRDDRYNRYYDREHRDYHVWNDREQRAYRHWLEERREKYREFAKENFKQREEYWRWRHRYPGDRWERH